MIQIQKRFFIKCFLLFSCQVSVAKVPTVLPDVIVLDDAPVYGSLDSGVHASGHTVNRLSGELLETFQVDKTEEIVSYLPNVQSNRLDAGIGEDFIVRGFSLGGRLLLDGILDNQSYYLRDPATIESVEIIKGHNSVLYGTGAPGGSVNYITKKPLTTQQNTLSFGIGSFDRKRFVLDSTGPMNQNKSVAYRSIIALRDSNTWKNNVIDKSYNITNSLLWRYKPNSHIITALELSYQANPFDFDNVYANDAPVYDVSYVHPSTTADRRFQRASLDWQHALTTQSKLDLKLNLIKGTREERQIGFFYLVADDAPLVGYYREVDESFDQSTLKLAYNHLYQRSEFTIGYARNETNAYYQNARAINKFGLDIYQPTFDFTLPTSAELTPREGYIKWFEQAIFLQSVSSITDNLEISMGVRKNQFNLDVQRNDVTTGETEQDNLSKSFSIRWHPQKNLEMYASYSDSFLPNSGLSKEGDFFDPQIGVQKELGWLFITDNKRLKLNVALFDITQSNLLIKDPNDPSYKVLAGLKQVTGTEIQAQLKLNNQLSIMVNMGLLDPRVRKSDNGTDGNLFPSVPQETGAVMFEYLVTSSISTNLGLIYQGKRAGDLNNSFFVDAYTRYDFAANWQVTKDTSLNLSVQNIMDIDYVTYATYKDFMRFGNPRTWALSVKKSL